MLKFLFNRFFLRREILVLAQTMESYLKGCNGLTVGSLKKLIFHIKRQPNICKPQKIYQNRLLVGKRAFFEIRFASWKSGKDLRSLNYKDENGATLEKNVSKIFFLRNLFGWYWRPNSWPPMIPRIDRTVLWIILEVFCWNYLWFLNVHW